MHQIQHRRIRQNKDMSISAPFLMSSRAPCPPHPVLFPRSTPVSRSKPTMPSEPFSPSDNARIDRSQGWAPGTTLSIYQNDAQLIHAVLNVLHAQREVQPPRPTGLIRRGVRRLLGNQAEDTAIDESDPCPPFFTPEHFAWLSRRTGWASRELLEYIRNDPAVAVARLSALNTRIFIGDMAAEDSAARSRTPPPAYTTPRASGAPEVRRQTPPPAYTSPRVPQNGSRRASVAPTGRRSSSQTRSASQRQRDALINAIEDVPTPRTPPPAYRSPRRRSVPRNNQANLDRYSAWPSRVQGMPPRPAPPDVHDIIRTRNEAAPPAYSSRPTGSGPARQDDTPTFQSLRRDLQFPQETSHSQAPRDPRLDGVLAQRQKEPRRRRLREEQEARAARERSSAPRFGEQGEDSHLYSDLGEDANHAIRLGEILDDAHDNGGEEMDIDPPTRSARRDSGRRVFGGRVAKSNRSPSSSQRFR